MANCMKKRFLRSRFASQYSINPVSSSVSIGNVKVKYRILPIATAIQNIYIVVLISNTLKLAYLLAQYLYTNKRLDLPGIGTFLLDPAVIIDTENNKNRPSLPEGISFQNNPSIQNAPELVTFISSKSGKMKALAIADLESHLQMAQQYLNINKPFAFEGIGTLVKLRQGEYEFTQGNSLSEKLKDNSQKDKQGLSKKENVEAKYQAYLATPIAKSRWRKPVIVVLILCGIGLAIWGGYTISSKQSETTEETISENNIDQTTHVIDSSQFIKPDSANIQITKSQSDNYKYVLEVAKAQRAFKRFNMLKENMWDVKLETSDSVQYKLFLLLPASSDTAWKRDSLTVLSGKKVYIEHQN